MKRAIISRERLITIVFVYVLALLASIAASGSSTPNLADAEAPRPTASNAINER